MGGGKGGGSTSAQQQTISTPPGLLQALSSVQGIGQYGTSLFDTLASLGNWGAGVATGGQFNPAGSFEAQGLQTGPQVTIGTGGPTGHDAWTTQFNPQTGQITFTNAQTGGQFEEALNSSRAQQYLPAQVLQQWNQDYTNRGQTLGQGAGGAGGVNPFTGGGSPGSNWYNSLGPSLQSAWNQIQSIGGLEGQAQQFTDTATLQGQQLYGQGQDMLRKALTGTGLYDSQQAWVNQGVQSEESQISSTLAAQGLGQSTSNAVLRGEAQQQGAATAGQLIQGNISAAQQQINLGQAAQKLALAGQTLQLGEAQAMAQLSLSFQAQTWQEGMQAFQTLGQMMSTTGAMYGIDVTGYSNMLQANISQAQLNLEAEMGNQQAAIGGMQSLGSGLGAIFGQGGLSGLLGGGAGAAGGAGAFAGGDIGTLSSALGSIAGGGGGAAAGGIGGLLGSVGSGAGSLIGTVGSALAAIFCEVARTAYGINDIRWVQFRDWILFRSPKFLRRFYARKAINIANFIKERPIVRYAIRALFSSIIHVDAFLFKKSKRQTP